MLGRYAVAFVGAVVVVMGCGAPGQPTTEEETSTQESALCEYVFDEENGWHYEGCDSAGDDEQEQYGAPVQRKCSYYESGNCSMTSCTDGGSSCCTQKDGSTYCCYWNPLGSHCYDFGGAYK